MIVIVFFVIGAGFGRVDLLRFACARPCLLEGATSLVVPLEVVLGEAALLHGEDKGDVFLLFIGITVKRLIFIGRVSNESLLTLHTFDFIAFDVNSDQVSLAVRVRLRLFEEGEVVSSVLEGHRVLGRLCRVCASLRELEHNEELLKIFILKTFL